MTYKPEKALIMLSCAGILVWIAIPVVMMGVPLCGSIGNMQ